MGRKLGTGISTNTTGTGSITTVGTTIASATANGNIVLDASGTGNTVITKVTSITDNTISSSTTTGTLVTGGGVGIVKNLNVGGSLNVTGSLVASIGVSPATPAAATFTTLTHSGLFTIAESQDLIATKTGASSTVTHDFTESNVWQHSSIAGNFTVNLTNVPTTNERAITISLILVQGATPYYATGFQIGGVSQTIKRSTYVNSFTPTANRREIQTFTLTRTGSSWSVVSTFSSYGELIGSSRSNPASSAGAILAVNASAPSGYYWIAPAGNGPYYTYCDMSSDGGGWMLMINARANNGGQYYNNSDYGLSTVNGISGVVEYNKSTTSMFGTTKINHFLSTVGTKWTRITPSTGYGAPTLNSPYTGMYQRLGTLTTYTWPGLGNECSNRTTLAASANTSWVLTQYKNWSDASSNANARVGQYTGGSHFYPTTYDSGWQNFWKGDSDGIRFSSDFNSESYSNLTLVTGYSQNLCSGYFWVKVT